MGRPASRVPGITVAVHRLQKWVTAKSNKSLVAPGMATHPASGGCRDDYFIPFHRLFRGKKELVFFYIKSMYLI